VLIITLLCYFSSIYTNSPKGPSCSWSHGNWIWNYNPAQARCTRCNIMW